MCLIQFKYIHNQTIKCLICFNKVINKKQTNMFYFSNIIYNQKKESMFKMFEYNPNLLGLIKNFQKITNGDKYENYNGKLN